MHKQCNFLNNIYCLYHYTQFYQILKNVIISVTSVDFLLKYKDEGNIPWVLGFT